MGDLLTYSLADFIPFTRDAYRSFIANHNADVWPIQILMLALAFGCCVPLDGSNRRERLITTMQWCVVGAFWAFLAFGFYGAYEQLNWAANYFRNGALAVALVSVALGVVHGWRHKGPTKVQRRRGWRNVAVASVAIAAVPIATLLFRDFEAVGVVGCTPLATAIFTVVWGIARPRLGWILATCALPFAIAELVTLHTLLS